MICQIFIIIEFKISHNYYSDFLIDTYVTEVGDLFLISSLILLWSKSFPVCPLLLLPLSHFSRVWLCVTPWMAAHQAPPSLGFSRQEYWSGLPFPSPMHESEKRKWSRSIVSECPTPSNPMDCSLPGSSVYGIFQERVLEWVALWNFLTYFVLQHIIYFGKCSM